MRERLAPYWLWLALLAGLILVAGGLYLRSGGSPPDSGAEPPGPAGPQAQPPGAVGGSDPAAPTDPPGESRPDLRVQSPRNLTRDQVQAGLTRLMNEPGPDPAERLRELLARPDLRVYRDDAVPWLAADLNGEGTEEFILALPVTDPGSPDYRQGMGAALFVIYRRDGGYGVDRSDPLPERLEIELMQPSLHGVADLVGMGRPQIIWSRPHMIASGPQPLSVFVTVWEPGAFSHLPGQMVISATPKEPARVSLEGNDVVLTGGSRREMFMRARTDRYRYLEGAFRLVDRRFVEAGEYAYDRFWDGLVAEAVGRTADALADYRAALEPERAAHPGTVPRYHAMPVELTPAEQAAFAEALRAFARFRLGALLLDLGREDEARAVRKGARGPLAGLVAALDQAGREAACRAAAAWAAANPEFLAALNRGVAHAPWTPELICSHVPLADG